MNKHRVPFPRYLNAKRLFYKYEYDVVLAGAATWAVVMLAITFFGVNFIISMIVATAVGYFVVKKYEKFFKQKRKGYIEHLMYEHGYDPSYLIPFSKKTFQYDYQKDLMPMGFEHEFIG